MQRIHLPEDYSLVLQEVGDHGAEELYELAETLSLDHGRLQHILSALQHKGLVALNNTYGRGVWIRLTAKGRKFMTTLWPESDTGLAYGY